jgi:hypothetical protein
MDALTVPKLVYGVFAEIVWLFIGAFVGFVGLFIVDSLSKDKADGGPMGLHGVPLFLCAILSAGVCAILSAGFAEFYLGSSVEDRVVACAAFNVAMLVRVLTHIHTQSYF